MSANFIDDHNISYLPSTSDEVFWNWPYLNVTSESLNTSKTSLVDTGGSSLVNMTVEEYLDYLNTSFADRLLPAVVVLAVLMSMGVVGNILVLFMYTCKSKRGTVTLFIQALAVFDLLSCCVAIPGEIIDMTNNYTFGSHSLCKIMRTVNLFCTVSSGTTLVVVAIDRYKRICCPLKRQITLKGATIVICICAISSLAISLPTAIFYGSRSISTDLTSVNGTDCSISDQFANTVFPIAYNSLQMFLFLVGAVTMIVLYSLIGSKVCHHVSQQQVRRKSICVSRSRFSPGGASVCSMYSGNTNTACHLESDPSICVNGREATELEELFQVINTHKDVGIILKENSSVNEKETGVQLNENCRFDCDIVASYTGEDASMSIHDNDCQKTDGSVVGCSIEFPAANSFSHKNGFINKCESVSGNNLEVELVNDHRQVKNLAEKQKGEEFKQIELRVEKQMMERIEEDIVPEIQKSNKTTNDNVPAVSTEIKNHSKRVEVSTGIIVSAASGACSQHNTRLQTCSKSDTYSQHNSSLQTCSKSDTSSQHNTSLQTCSKCDTRSQHVHGLSKQTITSLSAADNDKNNRTLLITDSTNADENSSTRRPLTPLELSEKSTNRHLKASQVDPECYKVSCPRAEDFTKKHQVMEMIPKASDSSCNNLQTNIDFMTQSNKSAEINQNLDGKECKNRNDQSSVSSGLVLTQKTTKKMRNSFKLKSHNTSNVGLGNAPLVRRMSTIAGRSDGNLDRLEEKVKVKETEYSGSRRTTLMLLVITLVYVLSFLPHLVLMALKAVNEDILKGLGTTWELAQNLLIRSYFINSMANPIIYSFFSRNFFRRCRGSRNRYD
ncbi:hypothetical protein BsWGS_08838 [Bradybaena similaris]